MKHLAIIFIAALTLAACSEKDETPQPSTAYVNYKWKCVGFYEDSTLGSSTGSRIVCQILDSGKLEYKKYSFLMVPAPNLSTSTLAQTPFESIDTPMVDPMIDGMSKTKGRWRFVFKKVENW